MLQEFILTSFGSFIGWQIFRYFSFFNLSVRLAPIVALAISYGVTYLQKPSFYVALAATGGVALLNKITEASSPEPLQIPKIKRPFKKSWPEDGLPPRQGVGHRIPQL